MMNTLATCKNILLKRRNNAISDAERRRAELQGKIPQVAALDNEISNIPLLLMEAARHDDYAENAAKIKARLDSLRADRAAILENNGFPADYDAPKFRCSQCNDRGFIKYDMCDCLRKMIAEENYNRSGLGGVLDGKTFETFHTYYYPGDPAGADKSPRDIMENVKTKCMKYADDFGKKRGSLLLMGGTGLGKTHISAAIGRVLTEKGYSVIYESARDILSENRENTFSDGNNDVRRFEACDLLIIDDLGSEPKGEYSASVFTDLIDKRLLNGKGTIISTNLTASEMVKSYSQRFVSRVLSCFALMTFVGKDIRMLKMTEAK